MSPAARPANGWFRATANGVSGAPTLLWLPAMATAAMVAVPLLYVFLRAFDRGAGAYFETVLAPSTLRLLPATLLLVAGVVTLALSVAVPYGWLVTRTDLPGRRVWAVLGATPLVFPSYVAAFSLVAVLGPRGYLQRFLAPVGVERLPGIAYGYSGALLALALFTYPYIYLLVVSGLRRLDPALEESSRSLGVGRWRTFFGVVLPSLRLSLLAGSLLVALYTLSDFGAVSITRYSTFTVSIYNAYQSLFDRSIAASQATVLVILTLAFIALEAGLRRRARPFQRRPFRRPEPTPLGRWKWPVVAVLTLLSLFTLGIPVGVVAFWGVRALWVGNSLGTALAGNPISVALEAALNSLVVAGLAALTAVALSVPIAAWSVRYASRVSTLVERLTYAGYALPGIVIALSLVFIAIRTVRPLYQTFVLLVMAYVVRFLPEAVASVRSGLAAIAPNFEEAARSLGRRPLAIVATLVLPMIRPGLLAGGALVFLTSMKELPATLILRPIGFDTLATRIWSAASEGIYSEASVPALFLVLASALPVYLLIIRPALAERA